MGVTVYLFMFFYFETRGICYLFTNEKGKRNPYLSDEEIQKLRNPKKISGFGGGGAVIEGSLVSWCCWSQNTGLWRSGFELHRGAGYLLLQPSFHFSSGTGNPWVPLCLPLMALASRLSPERGNRSVMSDSLPPCGLSPARLLCPWNFPGKNTGVGCHFLLQGSSPTQGWSPHLLLLALAGGFFTASEPLDCPIAVGRGQQRGCVAGQGNPLWCRRDEALGVVLR